MKVALDAQLTVGTATGIGEYVCGLTAALRDSGVDAVALSEPRVDPWRFDRRVWWDQVLLPNRARRSGAQLLHCASGTMPLRAPLPVVVTVHDVAWLRVQAHTRFYARYYFGAFSLARYREAARVVVDSEFSRAEFLDVASEYDPERVHVVYPGVASDYCTLQRLRGDGRTILVVGTVERRKNFEVVVRALAHLPKARAISVGPPTPYQAECAELAAALGVADRIEFRGYLQRSELLALYASCGVLAQPSRYEGFGYAAAQALCAGTPCVVSDAGALVEIAGGDAPSIACDDVEGWAGALGRALDANADLGDARSRAIERFGWPAGARTMRDVYEAALAQR